MSQIVDYKTYRPLLDSFTSLIQEALGSQAISIVLYGSVARGDARAQSDVDLLLVLEEAAPIYRERLRPLFPVLRRLRQQPCWKELEARHLFPFLSVVVLSQEEADQNRLLYLDMIEDALILLDRGDFFRNRLNILQRRLRELGAQKIRRHEGWYWDLKPNLKSGEVLVL